MSKFAELAKQGIVYRPLSDASAEQAPKPEKEQGNFSRGFEKAMLQVPQTLGGSAALVGDLVGADGLKEYGLGVYEKNSEKIQAITKDSDSLSNVLDGDASGADWLSSTGGYVAGQAVQALATGGVGGFIGSQLAKRGISGVVARGANSLAAREVASKVAARGAKWGAGSALLGSNLVQEAGSIYPEALHVAAEEGRELDGGDKARVVASSVGAAAVDTAMDALMLGRVLKGARKPGESMLRAGAREVPGAMARESVTEGIQTGIERYGAGQELNTAEAMRDFVDSMGVGAVGGGAGGAASVIRANRLVPESGPLTRAANISTEQQVLQLENNPQQLIAFPDGSVGDEASKQAYLSQFADPEERQRAERQLMGRDPETGKRIEPPKEEPAKSAESPEQEAQLLADWAAQHEPVPIEQAQALLAAPGTKGENLMVAPHPSGEGFTLVPSEWLTLDSQARHAELQKPAKPDAKGKADAVPAGSDNGKASADHVAQPEPAAAVAAPEPGVSSAVPAADAAPGAPALNEPEWKTNPYTARKFANRELAEAFMANKGADPAVFEAREIEDGKFAIKRRATPATTAPTTEGAPDADNAVLPPADGPAGRAGDSAADLPAADDAGRSGVAAPAPGAAEAAAAPAGAPVQPDPVRATGSADADPALSTGRNSIDELMAMEEDAGEGFKKNDRAIAIIKRAAQGLDRAYKAKLTRAINKHTRAEKDGTVLVDPRLYEEAGEIFGGVEYMLRDAIDAGKPAPAEQAADAPPAWRDKLIPAMTDAELEQAIEHYGPTHKRTPKLQKALDNRRAKADPEAKKPDWRQATADKEAKLAEQLKTANDNAAARAAGGSANAGTETIAPRAGRDADEADAGAQAAPFGGRSKPQAGRRRNDAGAPAGAGAAQSAGPDGAGQGLGSSVFSDGTTQSKAPQATTLAEPGNVNAQPEAATTPEATPARSEEAAPAPAPVEADAAVDDGADIPLAFFAKVRISTDVLNEETGVTTQEQVPADQVLAAVREDIANLTALLKCMKG